jgi:hypothetical protein
VGLQCAPRLCACGEKTDEQRSIHLLVQNMRSTAAAVPPLPLGDAAAGCGPGQHPPGCPSGRADRELDVCYVCMTCYTCRPRQGLAVPVKGFANQTT